MKMYFLLLLPFIAVSLQFASTWIDPVIKQKIINRSEETISVIVLMKDTAELKDRKLVARKLSDFASNYLTNEFEGQKGSVLWNINGLHLYLNIADVQTLSQHQEVRSIIYDEEITIDDTYAESEDELQAKITWGITKIDVQRVWSSLGITGDNIRVGVLDTGYSDHPALRNRVVADRSFTFGAKYGPTDGHGHGTHCAGTIGGTTVDGKVIGVAPGVDFVIGRIFNNKGKGGLSTMLKGMQWMADPDEDPSTRDYPALVSNSWGVSWEQPNRIEPLLRAVQTWTQLGIVPVFAAGNAGPKPQTIIKPAAFNESITVGSTDSQDRIARFSSQGPGNYLGNKTQKPDLTAPGVSVYSSDLNGKYIYRSGTSMATPHVAGIIALMLEANPTLSIEQVREILIDSTIDLGKSGYDYAFGAGRIDAYKAVSKALQSLK